MTGSVIESNSNFRKAVGILKKTGTFFWLDQGTLLGCVRENRLLPWDHDIDFGVWKSTTDLDSVIAGFLSVGFQIEEIPMEMHCIHFMGITGKKVDITLYDKEGESVTSRWVAPNKGFASRAIKNMIEALEPFGQFKSYGKRGVMAETFFRFLKLILSITPLLFRKWLLIKFKALSIKYRENEVVKFSVPLEFLSAFRSIEFLEEEIRIPEYSEKYLSYVYGEDWRIPKENFDWRTDCGGLESVEK